MGLMAGTQAGFNPDTFRNAIQFVYRMGAPVDPTEQVTFHFEPVVTTSAATDGDGVPFDPTASRQVTQPTPIVVPCGVETAAGGGEDETAFGDITETRVKVYLLDVDYTQVKDAAYITLGGERLDYLRTEQPSALFDVGLYTMIFRNVDDV